MKKFKCHCSNRSNTGNLCREPSPSHIFIGSCRIHLLLQMIQWAKNLLGHVVGEYGHMWRLEQKHLLSSDLQTPKQAVPFPNWRKAKLFEKCSEWRDNHKTIFFVTKQISVNWVSIIVIQLVGMPTHFKVRKHWTRQRVRPWK